MPARQRNRPDRKTSAGSLAGAAARAEPCRRVRGFDLLSTRLRKTPTRLAQPRPARPTPRDRGESVACRQYTTFRFFRITLSSYALSPFVSSRVGTRGGCLFLSEGHTVNP